MKKQPYCQPGNAGLASTPEAVCRRLSKLFYALNHTLTWANVNGGILKDLQDFETMLRGKLEAEGWTMSYRGSERMSVRRPGHPKPFKSYFKGGTDATEPTN